jgi:hypothetical protein
MGALPYLNTTGRSVRVDVSPETLANRKRRPVTPEGDGPPAASVAYPGRVSYAAACSSTNAL